jgi:hypothetical protein
MKKIHVLAVASILGASAILGLVAATRTAGLGAAAPAPARVTSNAIAARAHRLDRVETALRRALRDRPPALPAAVPTVQAASPGPSPVQQVIYRRPAPIVVIKHHAGAGESEHEGNRHEGHESGEHDD